MFALYDIPQQGLAPWCGICSAASLLLQGHFITLVPEAVEIRDRLESLQLQSVSVMENPAPVIQVPTQVLSLPRASIPSYSPTLIYGPF